MTTNPFARFWPFKKQVAIPERLELPSDKGAELVVFHEFYKPPYGGGNQFLLALVKELRQQGHSVAINEVSDSAKACLFNSFNFDFGKLRELKKQYPHLRMIHRVDGPVGVYRGEDMSEDTEIWELNHELADVTVFQSKYSLNKHIELGLPFKNPHVITNAPDGEIFNSNGRIAPPTNRKIRLIASAWSDNPRKGGPVYAWLDQNLDFDKYSFTFVGRIREQFKNATVSPAVSSAKLAELLKQNDIYITASQHDPCSNALIEALTCGLPAAYLRSGGHPELVGEGGEGFDTNDQLLVAIDKIAANYTGYQNSIKVATMSEVAKAYSEIIFA